MFIFLLFAVETLEGWIREPICVPLQLLKQAAYLARKELAGTTMYRIQLEKSNITVPNPMV
ncbi:MAG: hypothetical protein CMM58_02530 [Rhodospirillaceae bacterium]|nr:hypothetical protein [Rhodospirillaceae bacterium]